MKDYIEEDIEKSLIELCQKRNFDDITIKEICEKSQISKQTFYNHFQDKYEVVEKIYLKDIYYNDFKDSHYSTDMLKKTVSNFWLNRNFYKNVLESSKQNSLNAFARKKSYHDYRYFLLSHNIEIDSIMDFKLTFAAHGFVYCLHTWVKEEKQLSVEEFTEFLIEITPTFIKELWD